MKKWQRIVLAFGLFFSSTILAVQKDNLRDLAVSQNLKELLLINQKINYEDSLKGACQQQIIKQQWPTACWEWLEFALNEKKLSMQKQQRWVVYLNRYCQKLGAQQTTAIALPTRSILWRRSRCATIAKNDGLNFENDKE